MARYGDLDKLAVKWRLASPTQRQNFGEIIESHPTADVAHKTEWISVEERLPDTDEQVLVYGMRGSIRVCRYESRYDQHFRGIKTAFYRNDDKKAMNVRYWMPMPEAPRKGGGAE